eukprot:CAMPEP_0168201590 /NCGR_PEP_ID=MMETSP0139_2-20121125/23798_1 /TAXON_ID=44445 /ORGANISM="Pseudo-nitzschia australis, Strain 10249 10 AB" /LENGTH=216 /DNA_ID=CAMNT_0008127177 /DNA_START=219 /DNA_END=869 /DNA_ORIENTATION=+
MAAMSYDEMLQRVDHFEITVPKPMGVIFGENPEPYLGLVVDDVSEGMNGGRAGVRAGDQLLAINEQIVIGKDFDFTMDKLQEQPGKLNLILYRGPVTQLFTVLSNQLEDGQSMYDEDDYGDEESEPVIMDENYESPVRVEIKEQKPLTPGDFVKAFGKLGSMLGETLTSSPEPQDPDAPPAPKKKTGFFGIGAESVQLDGVDAQGYRREKIEPDEF